MTEPRDRTLGQKVLAAFGIAREPTQRDYALVDHAPIQETPTMNEHEPAARTTDLDTSHAAAASITGHETLRTRLHVMLATRYPGGLTHEEIITAYAGYVTTQGWPTATAQGIRSRVKELERDCKVRREDTPTGKTANGRRSYRWIPVTDPDEQDRLRGHLQAAAANEAHDALVSATPAESATSEDMIEDMAKDIRLGYRQGMTPESLAEKLVALGWHR